MYAGQIIIKRFDTFRKSEVMSIFNKSDIIILFLSLALMLGLAKLFGELFTRMKLPAVIGEILAGIILGPTVFGRLYHDGYTIFFPTGNPTIFIALEAFILIGVVFLLLTAGLEVELSSVIKQGKSVAIVSSLSIIFPFAIGAGVVVFFPQLFGLQNGSFSLAIFIGISLSITALPLIAKILLNLKLFHSEFGMLIMASAVIKDLIGWLIFSVNIQLLETGAVNFYGLLKTLLLTVLIAALTLTAMRYLINLTLPWIQAKTEWPGGVITFTIVIGLILSAIAEAAGTHAILGAFLAGIAIGDSPHLREQTKNTITQFIDNIFAPLFFVSIGLRTDFIGNFNPTLVIIFLLIIYAGKFTSTAISGKIAGYKLRESFAIGAAMSSSGAMGIILGVVALRYGLINGEIFEAVILAALTTSITSGPLIKYFLKPVEKLNFLDLLDSRLYISNLKATDRFHAIKILSKTLKEKMPADYENAAYMVTEREKLMSTGIGQCIAIPNAKLSGLTRPVIVVARSEAGIDFNSIDGKPAKIIFMILTPLNDHQSQIQILADISSIFQDKDHRESIFKSKSFNEFVASIKPVYSKQK